MPVTGTPRRPGADMAALDGIEGRGLREKLNKTFLIDQLAVDAPADRRSLIEHVLHVGGHTRGFPPSYQRPTRYTDQKAFQVSGGGKTVGILLRDHLALLGHPHLAVQSERRQ